MGGAPLAHMAPLPSLTLALTRALAPTLIKIEYWDRAGGGGNISYDW